MFNASYYGLPAEVPLVPLDRIVPLVPLNRVVVQLIKIDTDSIDSDIVQQLLVWIKKDKLDVRCLSFEASGTDSRLVAMKKIESVSLTPSLYELQTLGYTV